MYKVSIIDVNIHEIIITQIKYHKNDFRRLVHSSFCFPVLQLFQSKWYSSFRLIDLKMEDTPYLLPSEIARLVYGKTPVQLEITESTFYFMSVSFLSSIGQLKDLNCDEVAEKFLHTSPHMRECRELQQNNHSFTTKAYNLSLEEIIDQFLRMNELR